MAKPFIRKTGFWADSINGLLLRKPYRTYNKAKPAPEQREETSSSATTPAVEQHPQVKTSAFSSVSEENHSQTGTATAQDTVASSAVTEVSQAVMGLAAAYTTPFEGEETEETTPSGASAFTRLQTDAHAGDLPLLATTLTRLTQQGQEPFLKHLTNNDEAAAIRRAQEVMATAVQGTADVLSQVHKTGFVMSREYHDAMLVLTQNFHTSFDALLASGLPEGNLLEANETVSEVVRGIVGGSVVVADSMASSTPPPRFPAKLWEKARAMPSITGTAEPEKLLSDNLHVLASPEYMVHLDSLMALGFSKPEAYALSEMLRQDQTRVDDAYIHGDENMRAALDKAYDMFGVTNPKGVVSAVCWLGVKEMEAFARNLGKQLANDVIASEQAGDDLIGSSSDQQGNRPTVSNAPGQEPKSRHRRSST